LAVIYSISLAVVILLKDVEFICTLVLIFVVDFSDLLFIEMLSSVVFDDKSDCIVDESWALGLKASPGAFAGPSVMRSK
jgi:hypothetical protein